MNIEKTLRNFGNPWLFSNTRKSFPIFINRFLIFIMHFPLFINTLNYDDWKYITNIRKWIVNIEKLFMNTEKKYEFS